MNEYHKEVINCILACLTGKEDISQSLFDFKRNTLILKTIGDTQGFALNGQHVDLKHAPSITDARIAQHIDKPFSILVATRDSHRGLYCTDGMESTFMRFSGRDGEYLEKVLRLIPGYSPSSVDDLDQMFLLRNNKQGNALFEHVSNYKEVVNIEQWPAYGIILTEDNHIHVFIDGYEHYMAEGHFPSNLRACPITAINGSVKGIHLELKDLVSYRGIVPELFGSGSALELISELKDRSLGHLPLVKELRKKAGLYNDRDYMNWLYEIHPVLKSSPMYTFLHCRAHFTESASKSKLMWSFKPW